MCMTPGNILCTENPHVAVAAREKNIVKKKSN